MSATLIDGKKLSALIREEIKLDASEFERKYGRKIGLAVILAGENPASKIYVRNKIVACEETGIKSFEYYLPESVTTEQLLELVETINSDENIDGLLVQLPLPKGVDEKTVLKAVSDVTLVSYDELYGVGDEFGSASLKLTYADESEETVSVTEDMLSQFDTSSGGVHTVVVDFEGRKTLSYEITVAGRLEKAEIAESGAYKLQAEDRRKRQIRKCNAESGYEQIIFQRSRRLQYEQHIGRRQ